MSKQCIGVAFLLALTLLSYAAPSQAYAARYATSKAAYGCSGNGCNGLFAAATGCNSGDVDVQNVNITNRNGTLATIQLYYSPGCGTNWTHMHNPFGFYGDVSVVNCNTSYKQTSQGSAYAYDSPMLYLPTTPAYGFGDVNSNGYIYSASTACH